jgi:hypothetical protein
VKWVRRLQRKLTDFVQGNTGAERRARRGGPMRDGRGRRGGRKAGAPCSGGRRVGRWEDEGVLGGEGNFSSATGLRL